MDDSMAIDVIRTQTAGRHRAVAALAALAALTAAGCSVLLDPERFDDVVRCHYDDDCPASDDPRYAWVCTVADGHPDRSFPKVCAPSPVQSCAPSDYAGGSTIRGRVGDAREHPEQYVDRCDELGAVHGCPPDDDGCTAGLVAHPVSGRCDDDDPSTPPALMPQPSVEAQDVLDQFCRSVFCNPEFVCNRQTERCTSCVLGDPLGRGGCGDLYPDGKRSTIYVPDEDIFDACGGPDGDPEDALIGEFEGGPPQRIEGE